MNEKSQPTSDDNKSTQTSEETKETEQKQSDSGLSEPSLLNEKKTEEKSEEKKTEEGAPEKYSDFTLPEGFEANETVMTEAQTLFKELGLPQASAQKVVDLYTKVSMDASDAPFNLWMETQKKWKDEIKADPEIGGKLDEVRSSVARVIDGLGEKLSKPFREAMDYTGAGNNPAFIRAMYALAQKLSEGSHVAGKPAGGAKPSAAQALYPNLPSTG